MHEVTDHSVVKLIAVNQTPVLFKLSESENYLTFQILNEAHVEEEDIRQYVFSWLDLDRDIAPFYQLLKQEKDLAFMEKEYFGLRLIAIPDLFEALCWSVIGQQINLTFAYKCKRALVEKYACREHYSGKDYFIFPSPEVLANLEVADLRALQFSRQKASYIIGIARLFVEKPCYAGEVLAMESESEIFKRLEQIKGVGVWTANYVMMKSLKCPNALTYGDAGLFQALHALKGFSKKPSVKEVNRFFEPFSGWKAYLVQYLWRSLSSMPKE